MEEEIKKKMPDLSEIRLRINEIDTQISRLFSERMCAAEDVARAKAESGGKIYVPDRESIVIDRYMAPVESAFCDGAKSLAKKIMCLSREYQYEMTMSLTGQKNPAGLLPVEGSPQYKFLDPFSGETASIEILPDHNRFSLTFDCSGGMTEKLAEVLGILSDLGMELADLKAEGETVTFTIKENICSRKAAALCFQLACETENFRILDSFRAERAHF